MEGKLNLREIIGGKMRLIAISTIFVDVLLSKDQKYT